MATKEGGDRKVTAVYLDKDLIRRAKAHASATERNVSQVMRLALREYLGRVAPEEN